MGSLVIFSGSHVGITGSYVINCGSLVIILGSYVGITGSNVTIWVLL